MRSRSWLWLAVFLGIIVFVIEVSYAMSRPRASDLNIYLVAADRVNNGGPVYDLAGISTNQFSEWYKYPPLLAGMVRPLAAMDYPLALNIWRGFLLLCLLAAIFLTIYTLARNPLTGNADSILAEKPVRGFSAFIMPAALAFLTFAFVFRPAIDAINLGQPDTLILLLMVLTLAALRSGRPLLSGIPLALAVALKLFPGVLVLYLVIRKEWRALADFVAALVGWVVIGALITSPSDTTTYITQVLPGTSGTTAWPANQTIAGFFARLFTDRFYRLEPFPSDLEMRSLLLKLITYAAAAAVLGLTLWLSRKPAARTSSAYALGFCTVMTAGIFVLPVAWIHYFTSLLLAFAVALYTLQRNWMRWRQTHLSYVLWSIILLAISAVFLAYENIWFLFDRTDLGGIWILSLSYKLYGEIALWCSLLMLQRLTYQTEAAPVPVASKPKLSTLTPAR